MLYYLIYRLWGSYCYNADVVYIKLIFKNLNLIIIGVGSLATLGCVTFVGITKQHTSSWIARWCNKHARVNLCLNKCARCACDLNQFAATSSHSPAAHATSGNLDLAKSTRCYAPKISTPTIETSVHNTHHPKTHLIISSKFWWAQKMLNWQLVREAWTVLSKVIPA